MTRGQRAKYPRNWEKLAALCKERADYQCEHCGIEQGSILISRKGKPYRVYLHAAHINHDTTNRQPELRALCIRCHARYDYQQREREQRITLERLKHRIQLAKTGNYHQYGG